MSLDGPSCSNLMYGAATEGGTTDFSLEMYMWLYEDCWYRASFDASKPSDPFQDVGFSKFRSDGLDAILITDAANNDEVYTFDRDTGNPNMWTNV